MVVAPCFRFAQAAAWNGQAPQSTTGVANAKATQWEASNSSAGIIETRRTGTERTAETRRRRRSGRVRRRLAGVHLRRFQLREHRSVAGRLDGVDELLGSDGRRVVLDGGTLGGVVDGGGHAGDVVEPALHAVRTRGAGHA